MRSLTSMETEEYSAQTTLTIRRYMTKVIAVANHKGGVGKTTSVASIGAALSTKGYNTLLVDLDAQANLTASLLTEDKEPTRTIYNALKERADLPVIQLRERLSLVPSSLELAGIELELSGVMGREYVLKDVIDPLTEAFDVILLDCPPSLGLLTINAFVACTDVVIPLTAEALPFKGLTMIEEAITMVKKRLNPSLNLSGIIITRWEGRKLNKMVEEATRHTYGDIVYRTKIRTNIAIAEAPLAKEDIHTYNLQSNGSKDYIALTDEIITRWL